MLPRIPCLALLGLCVGLGGRAHAGDTPTITFAYSQILDESCAELSEQGLDVRLVEETREILPQLVEAWLQEGPAWLQAAQDVVRQPFAFREAKAALVTCGLPSMSHPLLINMRVSLRAARQERAPVVRRFVGTVFHELLHRYVGDILAARGHRGTPLLRKYADELPAVRTHLHLFAIEAAVYAARGRASELEEIERAQALLNRGRAFSRARGIVREVGAEAFLKELRPEN